MSTRGRTLVLDSGKKTKIMSGDTLIYEREEETMRMYKQDGSRILWRSSNGATDNKLLLKLNQVPPFLEGLVTGSGRQISTVNTKDSTLCWSVL